ncbi:MAG TPA: 4a-hydroxytetrahydrobiopterin dehydratase [Planctomycetota bacterium]|mgnify:CR=1 FL=1|nr:4a-hydroxytetrahydrobiopterin dehydratase [Planctomycetota bacterium]
MTGLADKSCVPCRGGVPPLDKAQRQALLAELGAGWGITEVEGAAPKLEKTYAFDDFVSALAFTNRVGEVAEAEGHHPDLYLAWGRATVWIWTHKIDGLTESDFVLAAKIEGLTTNSDS